MSKKEAFRRLKDHLAGLFDSRFTGSDGAGYARAQGFADGYMQAIADLDIAGDRELLEVVNQERRNAVARADDKIHSPAPSTAVADFA